MIDRLHVCTHAYRPKWVIGYVLCKHASVFPDLSSQVVLYPIVCFFKCGHYGSGRLIDGINVEPGIFHFIGYPICRVTSGVLTKVPDPDVHPGSSTGTGVGTT